MVLAATPSLTFKVMKSALKRIFNDAYGLPNSKQDQGPSLLKEEPVFATTAEVNEEAAFASSSRRRHPFRYDSKPIHSAMGRDGKNPVGSNGKITTCGICGLRNHWAKSCPDKDDAPQPKKTSHDKPSQIF